MVICPMVNRSVEISPFGESFGGDLSDGESFGGDLSDGELSGGEVSDGELSGGAPVVNCPVLNCSVENCPVVNGVQPARDPMLKHDDDDVGLRVLGLRGASCPHVDILGTNCNCVRNSC